MTKFIIQGVFLITAAALMVEAMVSVSVDASGKRRRCELQNSIIHTERYVHTFIHFQLLRYKVCPMVVKLRLMWTNVMVLEMLTL